MKKTLCELTTVLDKLHQNLSNDGTVILSRRGPTGDEIRTLQLMNKRTLRVISNDTYIDLCYSRELLEGINEDYRFVGIDYGPLNAELIRSFLDEE